MGRPKADVLNRNCSICSLLFETPDTVKGREKITCSKSCASKLALINQTTTHPCIYCGTVVQVARGMLTANLPVYCKTCSDKRYRNICAYCEVDFMAKRANVSYCSQTCETIGRRQKTVMLKCSHCDIEYEQATFNIYSGKRSYCSTRCRNNAFSLENPSRYGGTWSRWCRDIYSRDGGKCIKCSSNSELQVHHFRKLTQFVNPDDAHFDDNLGLFCQSCHDEIENSGITSLSDFYRRYSPTP